MKERRRRRHYQEWAATPMQARDEYHPPLHAETISQQDSEGGNTGGSTTGLLCRTAVYYYHSNGFCAEPDWIAIQIFLKLSPALLARWPRHTKLTAALRQHSLPLEGGDEKIDIVSGDLHGVELPYEHRSARVN
jgi:hypothetical protein